jgi:hypothetical protein
MGSTKDRSPGKPGTRSQRGSGRPDRDRPDHRRLALADEAARIMQDHGVTDFREAKSKAAERLGLGRNAPLPDNTEITNALAERHRIFHAESQPEVLLELRTAAFHLMVDLEAYEPRLVGDVLSGIAGDTAGVDLHLFCDSPEEVAGTLDRLGIHYRFSERRHRLRRDTVEAFPAFRLHRDQCDFRATVFPLRLRGHAPLSPVDGKPMRRASAREVAELFQIEK